MSASEAAFDWRRLTGVRFGPKERFEIRRFVGQGAFGVVFEVWESGPERSVAAKFLRPGLDLEAVRRFEREASRFPDVDHPGVVRFYGHGRSLSLVPGETMRFILFEFVHGRTLRSALERGGALAVAPALGLMRSVIEATDYLHARNVVHRDLKPENIMILEQTGRPKILDFGIAKDLTSTSTWTQANTFVGTPAYAAPEQIAGEKVDARTDIFALGVIFFEMLTGIEPFHGRDKDEIFAGVLSADPPVQELAGAVAEPLVRIVLKMMQKTPRRRFQSCAEVLAALVEVDGALATPAGRAEAAGLGAILRRRMRGEA
jgi:eukaryotic-like serine/threonine-protein kinase